MNVKERDLPVVYVCDGEIFYDKMAELLTQSHSKGEFEKLHFMLHLLPNEVVLIGSERRFSCDNGSTYYKIIPVDAELDITWRSSQFSASHWHNKVVGVRKANVDSRGKYCEITTADFELELAGHRMPFPNSDRNNTVVVMNDPEVDERIRLRQVIESETLIRFGSGQNYCGCDDEVWMERIKERERLENKQSAILNGFIDEEYDIDEFNDRMDMSLNEVRKSIKLSEQDKRELRRHARDVLKGSYIVKKHRNETDAPDLKLWVYACAVNEAESPRSYPK